MTIDHIGVMFFPHAMWMRAIGRLTFPIMAFLISEGFRHTKNLRLYEFRLFLFALISAIPYHMAFGSVYNVFFTLFGGLVALDIDKRVKHKGLGFICMIIIALLTYKCDWGFNGVITIYIFGKIKNKDFAVVLGVVLCIVMYLLKRYILLEVLGNGVFKLKNYRIMFALLLSIIPLVLYNGKRGFNIKNFFYIYYPAHIIILYIILNLQKIISF